MTLFTIDQTQCKRDGICAAQCPMGIIKWKKGELPEAAAAAEALCINCGHCVAVCPHGAFSLKNLVPADCLPMEKALTIDQAQTEQFLRGRRSIRNFKEDAVDKETLNQIIRLASHAPSGHNSQPVQWRVLNGRDVVETHAAMVIDWMKQTKKENPELAKLMHLDMIIGAWKFKIDTVTRNAPTLILAQGHKANPMAPPACTIAMTYLDLAAQSFGVGTCWCGYFLMAAMSYPALAEKLGKNDGLRTYAVMMAGYPKIKYHRMPPRNAPNITWME